MDGSNENIQFSWGKKRAKGGAKMDTQFYDSFTFDNVKYSLYDNVYLFKSGESEPYIGKIIKIWQQNQVKKVKILWFFLPDEIKKHLSGPVMEREIFLASGEGTGLADINPLEAIAGKCTVVCISKDERNRQPSHREQAMADYIFYRFFDVKECKLSEQLPEKIAGLEGQLLLNPKVEQVTSCSDQEVHGVDQKVLHVPVPLPQSTVMEDESPVAAVSQPQSVAKEEIVASAIPFTQSVAMEESVAAAIPPPQVAAKEENVTKPTENVPKSTVNIPKSAQKVLSGERPPKRVKFSENVTVKNVASDVSERTNRTGPLELAARQADRSKWFKIPWHTRLQNADEQGTLVYIQNLDIQFAAADIEELIRDALQLTCIAKPINHPTYDDPNNGKAYAIFKTKSAADSAISKINSGLVVGGRPLYCSKGLLKVPKPSETLTGHLTISNLKMGQRQREEQKKAVSTSHCSQPNTMEYDLALDWMLIREKQDMKFRLLQKKHNDERKTFASKIGK
ncbi:protein ANTI-SILENCING 1-like [Oryza brachyantha]|uniref:BAH domain-containing protein n=1 Tax=Oryza brachyantha TaxID=4533 RepID=J3L1S9_ORYBR|nr:protein ANTI-SILENCING 1-like [Oryza brachyantha]